MYHVPLAALPRPCQHTLILSSLHPAAKLGGFKQHHPYKAKGQNIAHPQREVLPVLSSLPETRKGNGSVLPSTGIFSTSSVTI